MTTPTGPAPGQGAAPATAHQALPRLFGAYLLTHPLPGEATDRARFLARMTAAGAESLCEITMLAEPVEVFPPPVPEPRVSPIIDAGLIDGQAYVAHGFARGATLERLLEAHSSQGHKLPSPLALYLVREALDALDRAHERVDPQTGALQPVVHGNLSLSTLCLTWTGELRIRGLGLTPWMGGEARACRPPEQLRGAPLEAKVDVFAIGTLLYQLWTGEHWYAGLDAATTQAAQAAGGFTPRGWQQLHPDLQRILVLAVHPDVTRRYANAGLFRDDIDQFMPHAGERATQADVVDLLSTALASDLAEEQLVVAESAVQSKKALEDAEAFEEGDTAQTEQVAAPTVQGAPPLGSSATSSDGFGGDTDTVGAPVVTTSEGQDPLWSNPSTTPELAVAQAIVGGDTDEEIKVTGVSGPPTQKVEPIAPSTEEQLGKAISSSPPAFPSPGNSGLLADPGSGPMPPAAALDHGLDGAYSFEEESTTQDPLPSAVGVVGQDLIATGQPLPPVRPPLAPPMSPKAQPLTALGNDSVDVDAAVGFEDDPGTEVVAREPSRSRPVAPAPSKNNRAMLAMSALAILGLLSFIVVLLTDSSGNSTARGEQNPLTVNASGADSPSGEGGPVDAAAGGAATGDVPPKDTDLTPGSEPAPSVEPDPSTEAGGNAAVEPGALAPEPEAASPEPETPEPVAEPVGVEPKPKPEPKRRKSRRSRRTKKRPPMTKLRDLGDQIEYLRKWCSSVACGPPLARKGSKWVSMEPPALRSYRGKVERCIAICRKR